MLRPSYLDLINTANQDVKEGEKPIVQSRYSIVLASAKRARQLIAGDEPLISGKAAEKRPLSIAVEELYERKVKIVGEDDKEEQ